MKRVPLLVHNAARTVSASSSTGPKPASEAVETPFQRELVRLMAVHAKDLPAASGRALSAALGKSANHLWLILNRGMIPSGPAVYDLARVLKLTKAETDGLILKAIETKAVVRSRDNFWINEVARIAAEKEQEVAALRAELAAHRLLEAFDERRAAASDSAVPRAASE